MSSWNAQFDSEMVSAEGAESPALSRRAMAMNAAAPASLVNRTHRVVRHRATAIKARRSYVRSLLAPLALCSVLLALAGAAIWTGLYQYQSEAAEAVQDVATLATTEANNHLLLALVWFVPLTLALLVAVWVHRARSRDSEAR
jgi:hypothetical protein